jgi:hypothetical protein
MAAAIPSSGRQTGTLARLDQADPLHVAGPQRAAAVVGDQDAEVDQPLDLRHRRAGEVGKFRRREPVHTVSTGMLPGRTGVRPARRWGGR